MPGRRRLRLVGTPKELRSAINGMSDEDLLCRDFGHSWRPFTARYIPQRRQYAETLMCGRCRTERVRLIGPRGELLANRYVYAEGYLVKGMGRLTGTDRDALRLAALQTLLDGYAEDDAPKSERREDVG